MVTRRTKEIFSDSRFTIFVVESVDFQHAKLRSGGYLQANIEPLAVIVRGPGSTVTFDMLGNPVSGMLKENGLLNEKGMFRRVARAGTTGATNL